MTMITGAAIPRARYMTLLRGLELEIKTGMSIGRRSASAILKDEFGWPKNMSKKKVLIQFKEWCMDNVYPTFGDIVFEYEDELSGKKEWRYIRRGESGYYEWNDEFTKEAGVTAEQAYAAMVEDGLNKDIIEDMVKQSMFGWRED